MLLGETTMQRMDVSDVLLVCLAGDVEKGVTICLDAMNLILTLSQRMIWSPSQRTPER